MLPILHHKMEFYGIYQASGLCTSWKKRLSLKTLLNVRQGYGLNEKVIASAVSKSRKGYSTEDMIFFFLSSDNAGCQVKNKMANHMALNRHDTYWNSFFAYLYNLSPANRISFMLFTFHMLVQILFCTAFTKNTKQYGRHWRPLESGLNISSPWWILPCNNTDAFSCRFIWFDWPGFCSISIFSHLLTTSGFIQY